MSNEARGIEGDDLKRIIGGPDSRNEATSAEGKWRASKYGPLNDNATLFLRGKAGILSWVGAVVKLNDLESRLREAEQQRDALKEENKSLEAAYGREFERGDSFRDLLEACQQQRNQLRDALELIVEFWETQSGLFDAKYGLNDPHGEIAFAFVQRRVRAVLTQDASTHAP